MHQTSYHAVPQQTHIAQCIVATDWTLSSAAALKKEDQSVVLPAMTFMRHNRDQDGETLTKLKPWYWHLGGNRQPLSWNATGAAQEGSPVGTGQLPTPRQV